MNSGLSILVLLLGAAGMVLAALFYLRGEVAVPGKSALLGLRLAVLVIVTLLLLDVRLPGEDPTRESQEGATWVLLDADLSLVVPAEAGGRPLWDVAVERAGQEAERGASLAFATPGTAGPEGTDLAGLLRRTPSHPQGELVEGVARLAEAGADSVVVLSSFRREPGFVDVLQRESPIPVRLEPLATGLVLNAGIAELALPALASAGEPVVGSVSVFGEGGNPADTVLVEIRSNGALVETLRLPLPAPGAQATSPIRLPPSSDTGTVRVSAHVVLPGDAFQPDDMLARWVKFGELEGGIFLLSLEPGWEPRYLLPVLEAVTGLDGEGYLALGDNRFLSLGAGEEDPGTVGPESFRDRMGRSALLVLHGTSVGVPTWVSPIAAAHRAVIHFPAGKDGAALVGIQGFEIAPDDALPDPQVPASAVSPFLTGVRVGGLPPVSQRVTIDEIPGTQVVLRGRLSRSGNTVPLLYLEEGEAGRRAVVLADGFWRWGSRDGEARDAYRALWGGVTNWLLTRADPLIEGGVRPVARVQPRGVPLHWEVAPGVEGAEVSLLSVELQDGALPTEAPTASGATSFRGVMVAGETGIASTPPVDPGIYRYEIRDPAAGLNGPIMTAGLIEVEAWAPSLRYPPIDVPDRLEPSLEDGIASTAGGGRPLRTHPLPYVIALSLLCLEWLGRRRVGLR